MHSTRCKVKLTGCSMYADIYGDPVTRGRAMTFFMTSTIWGPIAGPIASGYLQKYGWAWPFWFSVIFSGVTWIPMIFLPETYGPIILKKRAKKMRKADPESNVYSAIEMQTKSLKDVVWVILARPIRMFVTEAIVLFSCIYTALIYAVFYMFLQVYPLIFPGKHINTPKGFEADSSDVYGFSIGETGLAFLPSKSDKEN